MMVRVANGNTLSATKIGDIQMIASRRLHNPKCLYLAPGLEADLISVRVLTRQSRIWTWFDGDRAMLYVAPAE